MKKYVTMSWIFLLSCICCVGCGSQAVSNPTEKKDNGVTSNEVKKAVNPYNEREKDKVIKHLSQYPNSFEYLENMDTLVATMPVTFNKEKLNDFIDHVDQSKQISLDIIKFTMEGDAIPVYIQYNGKNYYCFESYVYDSYAADDSEQYILKKYKYKYYFDIPNSGFDSIDFTGLDTGFKLFVLSNEKIADYDEYLKSEKNNFSVRISPFDTEDEMRERVTPFE